MIQRKNPGVSKGPGKAQKRKKRRITIIEGSRPQRPRAWAPLKTGKGPLKGDQKTERKEKRKIVRQSDQMRDGRMDKS